MAEINPDPHHAGYQYQPNQAVTASFPHGVDIKKLEKALTGPGWFSADQLHVFEGQKGADKLDLKGERHGPWAQFRRKLEHAFGSYESWVFDHAEEMLSLGGVVVVAFTGGDAARKAREVELLKSLGG